MNKKVLIASATIILLIVGATIILTNTSQNSIPNNETENRELTSVEASANISKTSVVSENLEIPWGLEFLPNGKILLTERPGSLLIVNGDEEEIEISEVKHTSEGGLLGVEAHPQFNQNNRIYLYYTYESNQGTKNAIKSFTLQNNSLKNETSILENIPGASYHDGGRLEFGPDGKLYATTGDATQEELAQNKDSLAGKILRMNPDGSIPEGNPFDNHVYSYGYRNPQGIDWDERENLWQTEHGPSGIQSGLDEINLIKKGENYGWPEIRGNENSENMEPPKAHSGRDETWAPADALFYNGSLFFTGLRGSSIYKAEIENESVKKINSYFEGELGRIRTIEIGPEENFYITTSNTDGRGNPDETDDKLIKINPSAFS